MECLLSLVGLIFLRYLYSQLKLVEKMPISYCMHFIHNWKTAKTILMENLMQHSKAGCTLRQNQQLLLIILSQEICAYFSFLNVLLSL